MDFVSSSSSNPASTRTRYRNNATNRNESIWHRRDRGIESKQRIEGSERTQHRKRSHTTALQRRHRNQNERSTGTFTNGNKAMPQRRNRNKSKRTQHRHFHENRTKFDCFVTEQDTISSWDEESKKKETHAYTKNTTSAY